jgi:hypothetical protein
MCFDVPVNTQVYRAPGYYNGVYFAGGYGPPQIVGEFGPGMNHHGPVEVIVNPG